MIFLSNRAGKPNIYRQRIDETSAEMLVSSSDGKDICRLSPDGTQILYVTSSSQSEAAIRGPARSGDAGAKRSPRVMRAPLDGGAAQVVVAAPGITNPMCSRAPATVCVFGQRLSTELLFSTFDPVNGNTHEVARLKRGNGIENSALSPNGKSIAVVKTDENRIRLFSAAGEPAKEIVPKNWSTFSSIDWAADSKGLFVTSNPTGWKSSLLYVDLAGNAHELWQVKGPSQSWSIASRDGKHLAIPAPTTSSNVWMAQEF